MKPESKKILLLSAYDASSHKRWRESLLEQQSQYEWTVLTLPPRHFSWRIRGNALSWAFAQRELLAADYDLVLATSMVDLATLKGLVPSLATVPSLLYFHENQLAYPSSSEQHASLEPAMVNLYAALAADKLLFNSEYNRSSFLQGVDALLRALPDHVPKGVVNSLLKNSAVLPVPLEADCYGQHQARRGDSSNSLKLVWNHRWEYDKGPQQLLALLQQLDIKGCAVEVSIVGEQFRKQPAEFDAIKQLLERSDSLQIGHWGYISSRQAYRDMLATMDVVLSTALHDFQGLSVLEAVAAGCLPVVPRRLCYPQWFEQDYCYSSALDDSATEAHAAATQIACWAATKQQGHLPAAPDLSALSWSSLGPRYTTAFESLLKDARS